MPYVVVDLLWTPEGEDRRIQVVGPFRTQRAAGDERRQHATRSSEQRTVVKIQAPWGTPNG